MAHKDKIGCKLACERALLIWASEASLARKCERAAKPRGAEERSVLARLAQIGELSRRLAVSWSAELVFSFLPDFKRRQPV